jgi:hypothetical protein
VTATRHEGTWRSLHDFGCKGNAKQIYEVMGLRRQGRACPVYLLFSFCLTSDS